MGRREGGRARKRAAASPVRGDVSSGEAGGASHRTLAALAALETSTDGEASPERVSGACDALRALAREHPERAGDLEAVAAELGLARDAMTLAVARARAARHVMSLPSAIGPAAGPSPRARSKAHLDERRRAARERKQAADLAAVRRGESRGLDAPVETLPGIGSRGGDRLRARGIETVRDALFVLPRRYDDERTLVPIAALVPGERQVTSGVVAHARSAGRHRVEVTLEPLPGYPPGRNALLRLVWFRAPHGLAARFERGARFRVSGMVDEYRGQIQMAHPETDRLDDEAKSAGIVPRYPEVPSVAPRTLARAIRAAVDRCASSLADAVPEAVRRAEGLPTLGEALRALHAPAPDLEEGDIELLRSRASPWHARLAFEEFFLLELALHRRRAEEARQAGEPLVARGPALRARACGVAVRADGGAGRVLRGRDARPRALRARCGGSCRATSEAARPRSRCSRPRTRSRRERRSR